MHGQQNIKKVFDMFRTTKYSSSVRLYKQFNIKHILTTTGLIM